MNRFNHFIWNGHSSAEFGIRILDHEIPRPSPEDRHDRVQIDGRDGDLFVSYKSIPSVDFDLPIHLLDIAEADRIVEWLRSSQQGDLVLSWDDGYTYAATYMDAHEVATKLIKLGEAELTFILHPWKYLDIGREPVTGMSITNPTAWTAKPTYIIEGAGDVEVLINDEPLKLRNVSGSVGIDTEREIINGAEWSNVLTYPFPELKPGDNSFNQEITVIPNWRVRL